MKSAPSRVFATLALAAALGLLTSSTRMAESGPRRFARYSRDRAVSANLPVGSTIRVAIHGPISTQTARTGGAWSGTIAEDVAGSNGGMIPEGSPVTGVIASAVPARKGSRAVLALVVRGIQVQGREEALTADAPEIIAGSTRARNLGVVAGGAALGAVVGNNVGEHNHTLLGALIGGATAAGVLSRTRGYQVELKDGTVLSFTVTESLTLR